MEVICIIGELYVRAGVRSSAWLESSSEVSSVLFLSSAYMRKQLDQRIQFLIKNNVKQNHRSFIVLVGDRGRNQVVNLHFLLSQARVSARPSVLWCYKKELGFTR
jgi:hypothetical protein